MTRTSLWFHTGDVRPARRLTAVLVTASMVGGLLVAPGASAQTTTPQTTTQTQTTTQSQTPTQTPPAVPAPTVLQTTPPPEPLVGQPLVEVGNGAIQLSLEQAIAVALRQNLDLASQLYVREQQRLAIQQALGIYDLRTDATLSASEDESDPENPTLPVSSEEQSLDFGFSQLAPWGGDFSIGVDQRRSSFSFRPGTFRDVPVTYGGGLTFGYTQPLLRNFGRLATERGLMLAQLDNRISREEFERQVTLTIQQVVNAYWDLVGAREQLAVAEESMALAREFHERNRIQVEVGTLAPLELVQSEAAIAERDEDIISAQATLGDAADELRRLLNLPPGELWEVPINAVTSPESAERLTFNVEEAVSTAFAERPELQQQQFQLEQNQINAAFFRNQTRPRLDLSVSYGSSAGSQEALSDVYSDLFGLDLTGWATSLVFAYPLQNRSARAQSASANLGVERSETELENLQDRIRTEVRQAARRVDTAAKQIEAARASVRFQERNLEAERKRYENGMSTSFEITQIQEDLTLARSREVNATIAYQTALTEYYRATGTLLEQQGVELVDPEQPINRFTLF
ncbi:MAG TPA: TolC family protein [Thermoanaerobaculia bacterium]|nr:TolC family protein [Thermoanaerobaculia bacterium]